jgi:hypothetical protein
MKSIFILQKQNAGRRIVSGICMFLFTGILHADTTLIDGKPVQEQLALASRGIHPDNGVWKGRLTYRGSWERRASWDVTFYVTESKRMMVLHSLSRGVEARALFLADGQEIFTRNVTTGKLTRRDGMDRFERILSTPFQWMDFAGVSLEAVYKPIAAVKWLEGNKKLWRIHTEPLLKSRDRTVVLVLDPELQYRPIRLDFFRNDEILYRTLLFSYEGEVLAFGSGRPQKRLTPSTMEALDLENHESARMEWYSVDVRYPLPESLFDKYIDSR